MSGPLLLSLSGLPLKATIGIDPTPHKAVPIASAPKPDASSLPCTVASAVPSLPLASFAANGESASLLPASGAFNAAIFSGVITHAPLSATATG